MYSLLNMRWPTSVGRGLVNKLITTQKINIRRFKNKQVESILGKNLFIYLLLCKYAIQDDTQRIRPHYGCVIQKPLYLSMLKS